MQYFGNAEIIFRDGEHTIHHHREIELEYANGDPTRFQAFILGPARGHEGATEVEIIGQGISWQGRVTGYRFLAANNTTTVEFTTAPASQAVAAR